MSLHFAPRYLGVSWQNDITSQLDKIYGFSYAVSLHKLVFGSYAQQWQSGLLTEYSDWGGGVIYSSTFGVDNPGKWKAVVTPYGNENCYTAGGVPCSVYASSFTVFKDHDDEFMDVAIAWSIITNV